MDPDGAPSEIHIVRCGLKITRDLSGSIECPAISLHPLHDGARQPELSIHSFLLRWTFLSAQRFVVRVRFAQRFGVEEIDDALVKSFVSLLGRHCIRLEWNISVRRGRWHNCLVRRQVFCPGKISFPLPEVIDDVPPHAIQDPSAHEPARPMLSDALIETNRPAHRRDRDEHQRGRDHRRRGRSRLPCALHCQGNLPLSMDESANAQKALDRLQEHLKFNGVEV